MSESDLYAQILTAHSHGAVRLFRVNAGMAWQGLILQQSPSRLVLAHPRMIRLGVEGLSDLLGWSEGGVFTAIEGKSGTGRLRPAQRAFIDLVRRSGGRAGVARSVEEAGAIIRGEI